MHQIIGADLSTSVPLPFACSGPPVDGVYSAALEGGDHRPCAPLSQAQPPWVRPHTTVGLAPMRAPTFVFVSVWVPLATSLHIRPYTRPYTHLLTPVPTHVPTHTHLRRLTQLDKELLKGLLILLAVIFCLPFRYSGTCIDPRGLCVCVCV